ncbi:hypothetical protein COL30_29565 [Bacillus pseudomycoides]|uniref:Uncharacterized protein n=1 Tax=Bacillus pseudomycoides TaxID=64104 RepID=A0A2B5JN09_9BACI|nr:hypothetical protein [Bacillus pseudomycoides]PDY43341.1 hypothetical protein CON79_29445 [Bacillus pseudomycoides]PEA80332.1 hypothetical protein CON99_28905 [Bacillus pseudomycoides]PED05375.1 hypothetical protein COO19_26840 [Bacillus pseudomycoides]PED68681.1 hypothetical protein CON97_29750 [Bacillus pseudomycoides]PEI34414.1 hypothetical protein CN620_26335 [Bacillus pseudomycoides]
MLKKKSDPILKIILMVVAAGIITLTFFSDQSNTMKWLMRTCWTIIFIGNLFSFLRKDHTINAEPNK